MSIFSLPFPVIFSAIFSCLALVFAFFVVLAKNPVSSVFSMVVVLFNIAALFAVQSAHFPAAIVVLVYAGAIMVLFVFVVMLLNLDVAELDFPPAIKNYLFAGGGVLSFFLVLLYAIITGGTSQNKGEFTVERIVEEGGNIMVLSKYLFSYYVFSFELVAMLLLLAVVGAIVLAKRKLG